MVKINSEIEKLLVETVGREKIALLAPEGYVGKDDAELVIVYGQYADAEYPWEAYTGEVFLAHISELESNGIFMMLKSNKHIKWKRNNGYYSTI